MAATVHVFGDVRVGEIPHDGALLAREQDALRAIELGYECGAAMIALPIARLGDGFFQLKTRIAGEILQKFMNYGFRVAVVGDIAAYVAASDALRDFVRESNRGKHVWFVRDLDELRARLEA